MAWLGQAGRGLVWRGSAGQGSYPLILKGIIAFIVILSDDKRRGKAGRGMAWLGVAWLGMARHGEARSLAEL